MKKIALAVLLSAVAAPAFAEGMYAGIIAGQTKYDFAGAGITGAAKDSATAVGILGGYSINENFAAELAYNNLGDVEIAPGFSVKASAMSLCAVGSFAISPEFSLFAKLGAAQTKVEPTGQASETWSGATFGIGGQYAVTPGVGIRVGYDKFKVGATDPRIDTGVTSIGGIFKF